MNNPNIGLARDLLLKKHSDIPIPSKSYLVLMTQRSGSTLLCAHLERIGYGRPIEAFNAHQNHRNSIQWEIDYTDPHAYIKKAIEYQTVNDVMGMKFNLTEFRLFLENARRLIQPAEFSLSDAEMVEVFFPGTRYIHLQRRNKVKQAISFSKALQNGIWNETVDQDEKYKKYVLPSVYDREHIECCFDILLTGDLVWQYYLSGNQLSNKLVWFEDMIQNYPGKMREIYEYLGIQDKEIIDPPLRKQSNQESLLWAARFEKETPWIREAKIQGAMETGNLSALWLDRSQQIAYQKEHARWQVMPAIRYKAIRTFFFRGKRKCTELFQQSKQTT